jgi:hypothetical protein
MICGSLPLEQRKVVLPLETKKERMGFYLPLERRSVDLPL